MKDAHLTLRLSESLARELERAAEERGVAKSMLAREAVATYLAPHRAIEPVAPPLLARELAARWALLPRLTPEEANSFAVDLQAARATLPPPAVPEWE